MRVGREEGRWSPCTPSEKCPQTNGKSFVITYRVCGRGNVFIVSLCLCVCACVYRCVCACVSVCLSVWVITFEAVDIETSFLVWYYILIIPRSNLSIKVIGSRSSHGIC